jgi:hypothetical protein
MKLETLDFGGDCVVAGVAQYDGSHTSDGWTHYAWTVTLSCGACSIAVPYRMGTAHYTVKRAFLGETRVPKPPTVAEVLYSLTLEGYAADQSFAEWCGDMGELVDSRKALDTYLQCQESGHKMRKLLRRDCQRFALWAQEQGL